MIKALLLSKHFTNAVSEKLTMAVGKELAKTKILFCDSAADLIKARPENQALEELPFVRLAREELSKDGYSFDDLDLNEYTGEADKLVELISSYDVAFFTGGHYFHLLDLFYKTGLIDRYTDLLEKGLVHVGFSAGAMIASENMKYYLPISAEDYDGEVREKGLGIFKHYIVPHYFDKPKYTKKFEKMVKIHANDSVNIIPLTNNQAIWVEGENWGII